MKKWILFALLLVLIAILCFLFFTPSSGIINTERTLSTSAKAFRRTIADEQNWKKWWPGSAATGENGRAVFSFNGFRYTITDRKINGLAIRIADDQTQVESLLDFLSTHADTIILHWKARMPGDGGLFKRTAVRKKSSRLENDMDSILRSIEHHYRNDRNIYGLDIHKELVRDSILISNYGTTRGYPDSEFIYGLIGELQAYIRQQGARETGYPMLNITTRDSMEFITRVAIPVDKKLPPSGNMAYKWMLGGGNILVTEVKGGPVTIRNAFQQMEHYVADHERIPPAIPFESLVTDRREKDTGRWVTRIYFPVM